MEKFSVKVLRKMSLENLSSLNSYLHTYGENADKKYLDKVGKIFAHSWNEDFKKNVLGKMPKVFLY